MGKLKSYYVYATGYFLLLYSEHLTYTRWAIIDVGDRQLEIFSSRSKKKQRLHVIRIIFCILCVCFLFLVVCLFFLFFLVQYVIRSIFGFFFRRSIFFFLPFILLILLLILLNNPILFLHWNRPSIRHMNQWIGWPKLHCFETVLQRKLRPGQIGNIFKSRSHNRSLKIRRFNSSTRCFNPEEHNLFLHID